MSAATFHAHPGGVLMMAAGRSVLLTVEQADQMLGDFEREAQAASAAEKLAHTAFNDLWQARCSVVDTAMDRRAA